MPLSDVVIRNAKPREKPFKMGDSLGLFLLVQPSGGKLWRFKYRINGREKKFALGVYPDVSLSDARSEEHTSELQSLMRISYAVFCLKKKNNYYHTTTTTIQH